MTSHPALAERTACLLRQAGLINTDYGNALATVELIGNDIDGLAGASAGSVVSCGATHRSLCHLRARAWLTVTCLARVVGALGTMVAAIVSFNPRHSEVPMLIAAPYGYIAVFGEDF